MECTVFNRQQFQLSSRTVTSQLLLFTIYATYIETRDTTTPDFNYWRLISMTFNVYLTRSDYIHNSCSSPAVLRFGVQGRDKEVRKVELLTVRSFQQTVGEYETITVITSLRDKSTTDNLTRQITSRELFHSQYY